jgi:glycosyltransferase involved in cell wall biosynthesis
LLYAWILRHSDHVFVQSDLLKRRVCAHGIDPRRVSPIVTGFSPSEIRAASRLPDSANGGPLTIVYLGTLNASRQLDVVIDALALLHAQGVAARLLLIGAAANTADRAQLESRAASTAMTAHVEFTGYLPHAQALEQAARADIGLSPIPPLPIFEVASPTKLIEYMALGLPVVANDHPEQKMILSESRAGICTPWGARHFARAVRWLGAHSVSERMAIGARGRDWVKVNRSYTSIADGVERKCLEVIARKIAE